MTCVAGLVHNGTVYMGGDSISVDGSSTFDTANQDKVFSNGPFMYAIAGSWRIRDIMQYSFVAPDHDPRLTDDHYMKTEYSQALMSCFEKNKFVRFKDEVATIKGAGLIIGYRGALYQLNSDFAILRAHDWGCADGSGYQAAFAVLWATRNLIEDPEERLLISLEAAANTIATVRAPFYVKVQK